MPGIELLLKVRTVGLTALFGLIACLPASAHAVQIYDHFPAVINPGERYVIYSHNLIAEGKDPKPVSPQFGLYDFPAIKQALFERGNFNLIAIQRKRGVEFTDHVKQLDTWVQQLIAAGVRPSRISLVGFSRGGQLTAYSSSHFASAKINTAILAICTGGDFDVAPDPPLSLGGNFLSIYETSDQYGSCAKLAARSQLSSFKEVAISTGKAHAAFFVPRPEWLVPLKEWIAATNR